MCPPSGNHAGLHAQAYAGRVRKDIDHEALKPAAWRIDALQVCTQGRWARRQRCPDMATLSFSLQFLCRAGSLPARTCRRALEPW